MIYERTFYDIDSLYKINIPANVTYIGDRAFARCDNLFIEADPGYYYIVYTENRGWYTIYKESPYRSYNGSLYHFWDNGYREILQYSNGSGLNFINFNCIAPEAFAGSSLTSISLQNIYFIGDSAFQDSQLENVYVYGDKILDIGKDAFLDTPFYNNQTGDFITVGSALLKYSGSEDVLTLPDNILTIAANVFEYSTISEINLNKTERIGYHAFLGANLKKVQLSYKTSFIANGAFADNVNLEEVSFLNADLEPSNDIEQGSWIYNTSIGKDQYVSAKAYYQGNTFFNCNDSFIIYLPENLLDNYLVLNDFIYIREDRIKIKTFTLTYSIDEVNYSLNINYGGKLADYAADFFRKGYALSYLYSQEFQKVIFIDINNYSIPDSLSAYKKTDYYNIYGDATMNMGWLATNYTVRCYYPYNDNEVFATLSYTIEDRRILFDDSLLSPYKIGGWYLDRDSEDFIGTEIPLEMVGEVQNLYAKLTGVDGILYLQGGPGSTYFVQVIPYEETVNLSRNILTRNGYYLARWEERDESGNPVAYYDDEGLYTMRALRAYLYAIWEAGSFNVTLDMRGGSGGTTQVTATYGQPMPSGLVAPVRDNYIFAGYSDEPLTYGGKYYDQNMNPYYLVWNKGMDSTIYAVWRYQITYDYMGVSTNEVGYQYEGQSLNVSSCKSISNAGYRFESWNTRPDGSGVSYSYPDMFSSAIGNTVLYARWYINYIFNLNGGSGTTPLQIKAYKGDYIYLPRSFEADSMPPFSDPDHIWYHLYRTHYTFGGWSPSSGTNDGMYSNPQTVVYNDYQFLYGGRGADYYGNYNLYAHWIPDKYFIIYDPTHYHTYSVYEYGSIFDINGYRVDAILLPSQSQEVGYNEWTKLSIPQIDGHTFYGWYVPQSDAVYAPGYIFRYNLEYNLVVRAVFEPNPEHYILKIKDTNLWIDNDYSDQSYICGASYFSDFATTLNWSVLINELNYRAETYRAGYRITDIKVGNKTMLYYWNKVPDLGSDRQTVQLEPVYERETYSVYFSTGVSGEYWPYLNNIRFGDDIIWPILGDIKKGYHFVGWTDQNGNLVEDGTVPDFSEGYGSDRTISLNAKWEPNLYKVTFDSLGGSPVEPEYYYYNLVMGDLPAPVKTGYIFSGWYDDSGILFTSQSEWNKTNPGVLTARWTNETYTLTLKNGEQTLGTIEAVYNYPFEINIVPEKTNYTFGGWYRNEEQYTNNSGSSLSVWDIPEDGILSARWIPKQYPVNYILNNGTNNLNNLYYIDVEHDLVLYAPDRKGYNFIGWYYYDAENNCPSGGPLALIDKTEARDLTLIAVWEIKTLTVSLDINGSDIPLNDNNSYSVIYESNDYSFETPLRIGYDFIGWFDLPAGGKQYTDIAGMSVRVWDIGDDTVLYAHWINKNYTVNLDTIYADAVLSESSATVSFDLPFDLPVPQKNGYSFIGWFDEVSNIQYTDHAGESLSVWNKTSNYTLSARWELSTYTITYNLDGGHAYGNPSEYSILTNTITLNSPYKSGYTFVNWTDSEGNVINRIEKGSYGDLILTANWETLGI
jgi:Listeria/Bacterioides repeat/Listeria/Bacterioides repeat